MFWVVIGKPERSNLQKRAFAQRFLVLGLSRACLGKYSELGRKWHQKDGKRTFPHQSPPPTGSLIVEFDPIVICQSGPPSQSPSCSLVCMLSSTINAPSSMSTIRRVQTVSRVQPP
jgi:hypothetical protein